MAVLHVKIFENRGNLLSGYGTLVPTFGAIPKEDNYFVRGPSIEHPFYHSCYVSLLLYFGLQSNLCVKTVYQLQFRAVAISSQISGGKL